MRGKSWRTARAVLTTIFLFAVLVPRATVSIAAATEYNRFMIANGHSCTISVGNASAVFHSEYFTSTFPNTVAVAQQVYYSTQGIDARMMTYPSRSNSSNGNIEYYLVKDAVTTTYLVTEVRGFLVIPLYRLFAFRYLLIFADNPWIGPYMTIQSICFYANGTSSLPIPLPSQYNSSVSSLSISHQIRDMKFQFSYSVVGPSSNQFVINYSYSQSATSFNFNLIVPSYFRNIASNQIRFLIILIDSYRLTLNYPNYVFTTRSYFSPGYVSVAMTLPFTSAVTYPNLMIGLCYVALWLTTDPSFFFTAQSSGNTLQLSYGGSTSFSFSYIFSYAVFPYFVCNNRSYPYFNSSNKQCTALVCTSGYYYNSTTNTCKICRYDCITCKDSQLCLTCNTTNRYLSNYRCLPSDGYYESNTTALLNCSIACKTCLNGTTCTSCKPNTQVLSNGTCIACSVVYSAQCQTCNQTACLACIDGYRLVNSTYCNLPCTDTYCIICDNLSISHCLVCKLGYQPDPTTAQCLQLKQEDCGNGRLEIGEACDDGNRVNWDGCDSDCHKEQDYNCYEQLSTVGFNYTTYCAYTKSIDFLPISVEKLDFSNEITIIVSVSQYQHKFWTTRLALGFYFIQTPVHYRNMRAELISSSYYRQNSKLSLPLTSSYHQNSLMKVTFEYLQPIHGKIVALCFNFTSSIDLSLSEIPPLCTSLPIEPDNNKYAHLYSQNIYQRQKTAYNICLLLSILSVVLLLVSWVVGGKRIIVDMLTVIQVTYIGLIAVPKLTPMFSALSVFSTANNGYNILYTPSLRPFEDSLSSERAKGVLLYSQFLYNLNTGLLFIIIPLLAGLIAFLVSKIRDLPEQSMAKWRRFYQLALGQYTFVGLLFCGCIVGASSVMEVQFGMKEITTQTGLFSLAVTAVLLLLYPVYGVLRARCAHLFDEFSGELKESKVGLAFQIVCFFLRVLAGALLCAFNSLWYINGIVLAVSLLLYLMTLCILIFKKPIDRYRTQLNLLTIAFAQIPYLYSNISSGEQYKEDDSLSLMAPSIIVGLLSINFAVNFAYFAYEAIKKARVYLASKKQSDLLKPQNEEKENAKQCQKTEENPLLALRKIKYGFIELTEKDEGSINATPTVKKSIQILENGNKGSNLNDSELPLPKAALHDEDYIHAKFDIQDEL